MATVKPGPYDNAERDLEANFESVNAHVEDKDFKLWLPARVWNDDSTGAAVEGSYVGSPYWELPDGVTAIIVSQHYRPTYWTRGLIAPQVYYTGDTSSTDDMRMRFRLTAYQVDGTALTSTTGDLTATVVENVAAPANADELQIHDVDATGWLPITADYPYFAMRIIRLGADADDNYAGDGRILGVMLRFYPTRR